MSPAEPIIFREERKDGQKRVYCIGGWPDRTAVARDLIDKADASMLSRRGDEFIFIVANGSAIYKHCAEQPNPDIVELELCNGFWRAVPLLERVA